MNSRDLQVGFKIEISGDLLGNELKQVQKQVNRAVRVATAAGFKATRAAAPVKTGSYRKSIYMGFYPSKSSPHGFFATDDKRGPWLEYGSMNVASKRMNRPRPHFNIGRNVAETTLQRELDKIG